MGKVGVLIFLVVFPVALSAGGKVQLLHHNPPAVVNEGESLNISVDIAGFENVRNVILFFRGEYEKNYKAVFLFPKGRPGHFEGIIPADQVNPPGIYYYIAVRLKNMQLIPIFASSQVPQFVKVKKREEEIQLGGEIDQLLKQGLSEEVAYFKAEQEVKSASGFKQKKSEAPASIVVLRRRDLLRLGTFFPCDAFFYVPGVRVVRIDASDIEIGMRGLATEENKRVLTLIDDRPAYVAFIGITPYITFPLYIMDIDRIEFVKGPVSTIYGPNAYSGAINIYLRDPHKDPGTYFYFAIGDKGLGSSVGEISSAGVNGKITYRSSIGWQKYEEFSKVKVPEYLSGVNNPVKVFWGDFSIGRDLKDGYVRFSNGLNYIYAETAARSFLFQNYYGYFGYGRFDFKKSNFRVLSFVNYYDTGVKAYIKPDTSSLTGYLGTSLNLSPNLIDTYVRGVLGEVDLIYSTIFQDKYRLRLTSNYTYNYIDSPGIFRRSYQQNLYGFSLLNEDHFFNRKFIVNASFRYDHHPLTGEHFSPRLAFIFKPFEKHIIRLVGSSAYRNPTFVESDVDFNVPTVVPVAPGGHLLNPPQFVVSPEPAKVKGNENTKSEQVYSVEMDYEGRFFGDLKFSVDVYYNWYKDLIDMQQTPEGYTFGNIGNAHGYGSEVMVDWLISARWRFFANYSFSRMYNDYDNPYTYQNEKGRSKLYPEHIANAGIFYLPEKWEISLLGHYESAIEGYRDNDNIPYLMPAVDPTKAYPAGEKPHPLPGLYPVGTPDVLYKLSPYYLLRVRVAYLPSEKLTLFMVGQNILNYQHYEWPRDISEKIGWRAFGGFIYKF